MELRLRTLTPVHIGTGETLTPLDYVVDQQNNFFRVPQELFLRFLEEQLPNSRRDYADWITHRFEELRDIESLKFATKDKREQRDYNQRFTDHFNDTNVLAFCQEQKQEGKLLQYLRKHAPVQASVHLPRNQNRSNSIRGQVREAFKTVTRPQLPYIPGTSLKGSLRTALFYYWLNNYGDANAIDRQVKDQLKIVQQDGRRRNRIKQQLARPLETDAFYCATENLHRKRRKDDDEKFDLFKLISFSDAHLINKENNNPFTLADIKIYLVERQQDRYDRNKAVWRAASQRQTSYAEAIAAEQIFSTQLDFNMQFLLQLKDQLNNGAVQVGDHRHWIGIEKKVKQLFKLDIQSLTPENAEAKKEAVLQHLLQCMQDFCQRQITREEQWLERFIEHDEQDRFTRRIEQGWQAVLPYRDTRLMHLGYATGFIGITAVLYFLADADRKETFRAVMDAFRIGDRIGNKGRYKANPERFPKSRRMATEKDTISPLGWVQILGKDEPIPQPQAQTSSSTTARTPEPPKAPAEPDYYNKKLNPKKDIKLDAVVIKPARIGGFNEVEVYVRPDYKPVVRMVGRKNPMDKGTVVIVRPVVTKKGEVREVTFVKEK